MRPFSQRHSFATRDRLIQGDSVRQIWGVDEPKSDEEELRKPHPPRSATFNAASAARRTTCSVFGWRRSSTTPGGCSTSPATSCPSDRIAVSRHGMALQSLDIVGQMLGHIANVIRSSDPETAVEEIGMSDLKARLTRSGAL